MKVPITQNPLLVNVPKNFFSVHFQEHSSWSFWPWLKLMGCVLLVSGSGQKEIHSVTVKTFFGYNGLVLIPEYITHSVKAMRWQAGRVVQTNLPVIRSVWGQTCGRISSDLIRQKWNDNWRANTKELPLKSRVWGPKSFCPTSNKLNRRSNQLVFTWIRWGNCLN